MLFFILGCNSNKVINNSIETNGKILDCPEDGICSFEVLKNKTFNIKQDKFGNPYSELLDGNKTVLKFEYQRNTLPDVEDGNYSEIIYIEIENDTEALSLKDDELRKANIGFSRICFCRGQTGTYPITNGTIDILKTGKNTYNLQFEFKVSEVPQIISSINETYKL